MSSLAQCYATWDQQMSTSNPDYQSLYDHMRALASTMVAGDVELWWRLSAVTFHMTNQMDFSKNRPEIKAKTEEAKQYAEKALKMVPHHFEGNLWMAKAIGQLAQIAMLINVENATFYIGPLLTSIANCYTHQPQNWRLLLLDAQVHLSFYNHADKLKHHTDLLPQTFVLLDMTVIETKLRAVLVQVPQSIEAHFALMMALYYLDKPAEAEKIGQAGLALKCTNAGERYVAQQMVEFMPQVLRQMSSSSEGLLAPAVSASKTALDRFRNRIQ